MPLTLSVPMLVIISVVVVSVLGFMAAPLKRALLLSPYAVRHKGQVYRLVTGAWVHADPSHLLFNMITLYFFGDQLAVALGTGRFLLLYMTAVVVAHIPTTLRYMNNPKYGSLGASGAVAAVIFSSILLFPDMRLSLFLIPIYVPGWVYALGYLAYSVYSSVRSRDGVNHDAHFSGAIYGALLTFAMEPQRVQAALARMFH